jgi:hypothetical protein
MGLSDLIREPDVPEGPPVKRMTVVGALNAMRHGQLVEPAAAPGGVGGLLIPQPMPPVAPKRDPLADITAEQTKQDEADRQEMLVRVRRGACRIESPSSERHAIEQ